MRSSSTFLKGGKPNQKGAQLCLQQLLDADRQLADADADGVVHRVGNRGGGADIGQLAEAFDAGGVCGDWSAWPSPRWRPVSLVRLRTQRFCSAQFPARNHSVPVG